MRRSRKIHRKLDSGKNYYVIDACFLVNKYIPSTCTPNEKEKARIEKCLEWWKEIDTQIRANRARVYIPDICIAETFKALAQKRFAVQWLNDSQYRTSRERLRKDITITPRTLRSTTRKIKYHDISTSRDLIISVDRFYEIFHKVGLGVQLADLIILATAKYLMDFYDIPKSHLHIVTLDRALRDGSRKIQEIPTAYNPTRAQDAKSKVFID
jgi:predicted nucleic acid-binding protein